MSRNDGDLTNNQWANRLGKVVLVSWPTGVTCGILTAIGAHYVIVGDKRIPRCEIKRVTDRKPAPPHLSRSKKKDKR